MTRYEYKAKFIEELEELYPDITWETMEPSEEIEKNFGTGVILVGRKDGRQKEFFILEEDKRHMQWGHVIANYLHQGDIL